MKKVVFMFMVAGLALLALSSGGARAADNTITVTMNAQNGSGEDGTATITGVGTADIKVTVNLKNAPADPQPAHIHKGTCAQLDPKPLYPLTNVVNGTSDTTVMTTMAELTSGSYAINVHKSAAEVATYVSCGDIKAMSSGSTGSGAMAGSTGSGAMAGGSTMPATGNGDQPFLLAGLALLALSLLGAGMRLARRQV